MFSVVIVNWNTRAYLEGCLNSVFSQSYGNIEVIVVDNASSDGSVDYIRQNYPDVQIIENSSNKGFCAANNQGLARSRGSFVLFLNPDTLIEPDALEKAARAFKDDDRVGSLSGKILRFDRETVDSTGQFLRASRRVKERGFGEKDKGQYQAIEPVFSTCGAAAFYRRECIWDVILDGEFFDEDFFTYWEDLDAGWRARNKGWKCIYRPDIGILHARGGAFKEKRSAFSLLHKGPEMQYHIIKNRYLTMIKNDCWGDIFKNILPILGFELMTWGFLITHPAVLRQLIRNRHVFAKARKKRAALMKNS